MPIKVKNWITNIDGTIPSMQIMPSLTKNRYKYYYYGICFGLGLIGGLLWG